MFITASNVTKTIQAPGALNDVPYTSWATVLYLCTALTLGALSALAALLGDPTRTLTSRVVAAYIISGGLAAVGLTLLLIEKYGFSYFLVGIAVFAGYKAFDVLTIISLAVTALIKRIFGPKP